MCSSRSRRLKIVFIISALLTANLSFAQYTENLSKVRPTYVLPEDSASSVDVEETVDSSKYYLAEISHNVAFDSVLDVMAGNPVTQSSGFRIQVYSGDDRVIAEEIKARLDQLEILENIETYKLFESGFIWRIKVGDFQTRLDAYRVYKQLKSDFPNCLLVPDRKINLK